MIKAEYVYSLSGKDWTLSCEGGAFPTVPAQVPGNIQADLENARCLKPIYYGVGDERIWEVARHDWRYSKSFEVPAEWAGKRIKLSFDGADYACDVYLDGLPIASHEGQFERFSADITDRVGAGTTHELSVLFHKMPPELEEYIQKSDGAGSGEGTEFFFVWGDEQDPSGAPGSEEHHELQLRLGHEHLDDGAVEGCRAVRLRHGPHRRSARAKRAGRHV
ncbi:glycosyl hydrolase 2 galactose-binding domain-containing protein [Cohnella rhizosphaerae]|uniref:Beta-mannosidase-like galactose-binding domain-containing protein n=1 Tax=Cohnella rhizosphaerae TaxID=1457232 RepID=A0A9X4KZ05_9BACL|nr:sugar-binding domain-containing protein [Cohnella rhizosphaerae]MDG0813951.1 hypothetical protein [Cohnella rhizosphaerae]